MIVIGQVTLLLRSADDKEKPRNGIIATRDATGLRS